MLLPFYAFTFEGQLDELNGSEEKLNVFIDVYNGLQFINVFYSEILCENNEQKRIMRADEINKYIFGKEKFVLSSDKTFNFDIFDINDLIYFHKQKYKCIKFYFKHC